MRMKAVGVMLGVTALFLVAVTAYGDENHYVNLLIGDRASGMAGAYTAVSDDASGLYYNPAGAAYSTGRDLSASVNAYYNSTKKYEDVIGGNGWTRNSSSLLPNYFGIIQPVGKFKVGFSYAVPDSITEDQRQIFSNLPSSIPGATVTEYIINFNNEDNTYNIGPSVAMQLTNNFSAGLTLYYHQRKHLQILNQVVQLNTLDANGARQTEWDNTYFELSETGYRPVLGLMWSPLDKLSLGYAVSKTYVTHSSAQQQVTVKGINDIDPAFGVIDTNEKRKYPLEQRFGIAYFPSDRLLLSVDFQYAEKVTDPVFGNRDAVLNESAGFEYYLDKNWALRGGLFTDKANTPDINPSQVNQVEHVNFFGESMSVSHFTRNTSVTLGGSLSQGRGDAQLIGNSPNVQHVTSDAWTIYVSSSYSY